MQIMGGDCLLGLFGKGENVIVWGKFCGEKRGKSRKITWELGKKKERCGGLKMRTLEAFIKECTLCFLENMGRKAEKKRILERFKGR
jgi:hypothetical protein